MNRVVLTTDASNMSTLNHNIYLGFLSCLPKNICPEPLYRMLVPPVPVNNDWTAKYPTLPLRAVEAICVGAGYPREEVKIAHPYHLEKVIDKTTQIVGVSSHDPLGLGPATSTWSSIFKGLPYNRIKFLDMMNRIKLLKEKYDFTVVAGGTGYWQIYDEKTMDDLGIDYCVEGEGEISVPKVFRSITDENPPEKRVLRDRIPTAEEIPPVLGPSNCGLVEITRGCGRGCSFCSPTTSGKLRSLPIEKIKHDVGVHVKDNWERVTYHSDDTLRYGSNNLYADKDALLNVFDEGFAAGAKRIFITHASLVNFAIQPDVIEALTKKLRKHGIDYYGCQPGLETGSFRLMGRYMRGKVYPRDPEEWHEVVYEALKVMNENKWYPVCTLICGLPDERIDDIKMTIELIHKVSEFPALYIPLFFVPMTLTKLEDRDAFIADNMTPTHWELMFACWDHNLKYIYKLYTMVSRQHNIFLKSLIKSLAYALKGWMNIKREDFVGKT